MSGLSRPQAHHARRRRVRSQAIVVDPRCSVGFSVMINCEDGEAAGIAYELIDHYPSSALRLGAAWQEVVRQRDERPWRS
jgi:hypothetical protein